MLVQNTNVGNKGKLNQTSFSTGLVWGQILVATDIILIITLVDSERHFVCCHLQLQVWCFFFYFRKLRLNSFSTSFFLSCNSMVMMEFLVQSLGLEPWQKKIGNMWMVVRFFIERLSKCLFLFICSYFLELMHCCKLKQIFLFNSF